MKHYAVALLGVLMLSTHITSGHANAPIATEIRIATIIANGNYDHTVWPDLDNPINDGEALEKKLMDMGFTVILLTDLSLKEMIKAIDDHVARAKTADLALFFYAGHGTNAPSKAGDENLDYLIPQDAATDHEVDLSLQALPLAKLTRRLYAEVNETANIIMIDACRDNNLTRGRGNKIGMLNNALADGMLIVYAAKTGQKAADSILRPGGDQKSKHSPFMLALLEYIDSPMSFGNILYKVNDRVKTLTGGHQTPIRQDALDRVLCLNAQCPELYSEGVIEGLEAKIAELEASKTILSHEKIPDTSAKKDKLSEYLVARTLKLSSDDISNLKPSVKNKFLRLERQFEEHLMHDRLTKGGEGYALKTLEKMESLGVGVINLDDKRKSLAERYYNWVYKQYMLEGFSESVSGHINKGLSIYPLLEFTNLKKNMLERKEYYRKRLQTEYAEGRRIGDDGAFSGFPGEGVPQIIQSYIKRYVDWVVKSKTVRFRINVHTGSVGSREYNLGLGERRGKNVAKLLQQYGIGKNRIEVVSYGEESPVKTGKGNSSDFENDRVEIVMLDAVTFRKIKPFADNFGVKLVTIPAGSFMMGSDNGKPDERPQHQVTLESFYMMESEVTWDQYQPCIDAGACPDNSKKYGEPSWGKGSRPVIGVSWIDVTQRYIPWLNKQTSEKYRLPTESEWEYAARAGYLTAVDMKYSWGYEIGKNKANCKSCGSNWDNKMTAPVKSFKANPFGLYDMHGNVWEWVQDCYSISESYKGAPTNGQALTRDCDKIFRVVRGGGWNSHPASL